VAGDGSVVGLDDVDLDAALEVFLEVRRDPRIQLEQATQAAQAFLKALGVDLTRPGMDDTPARMARAYAELFSPRRFWATHFPDDEGYDQMVLAKRIPFRSVCEHHMLAFTGVAYLGYLPGTESWGYRSLPAGGALRRRATDAGATHPTDCRLATQEPQSSWRWCRRGGRAHLHDAARGPGAQQRLDDVRPPRRAAGRPGPRGPSFSP
jgi:hypothetical protein